jgi:thymidylate synthase ThyX
MTVPFEEFPPDQEAILTQYVSNTKSSVFVLHNLPEVIKGALFSRYSRSTLSLKTLLLKEFLLNQEEAGLIEGFDNCIPVQASLKSIKKAQNFYDRILDGYGDDSIGELGGAHLAVENISMLTAKAIEDCRVGGSPLEKSTRYIYFDQKVNGEYLYHKEAVIMTSAWKSLYLNTCNMLFETYSRLIAPLSEFMTNRYPKEPTVSANAYAASIRAKVLDCIRGLLPASTLTNMGLFGNGRFYENLLHKLQSSHLSELREIGKSAYDELAKIIPSFVRRADSNHKTHLGLAQFYESMHGELKTLASSIVVKDHPPQLPDVSLVLYDREDILKVAAGLLFPNCSFSFEALLNHCKKLKADDLIKIFDAASTFRENRRHKSPRALENAVFTFEIVADFGAYRDLQRHRILTQERQLLTCNNGYFLPKEIEECGIEKEYQAAMEAAKLSYDTIAKHLPEEAQYVVPMAYNVRWYYTINLRALQWLVELRSQSAGHVVYRGIAQDMAKAVLEKFPEFSCFLRFVDYNDYDIGRLNQETRSEQKRQGSPEKTASPS